MFERLRMQEVKQIIFSLPVGVIIPGLENLSSGDPVMIINKPNTSDLTFITRAKINESGKGFVGLSSTTSTIDFTINEGSVLFSLWSYLNGKVVRNTTEAIPCTEEVVSDDNTITLKNNPTTITLYKGFGNALSYIDKSLYTIQDNVITLSFDSNEEAYTTVYRYITNVNSVSYINQLHNNIICCVDIAIEAVDLNTDNKHMVYVHIDRAQIDTDLKLFINDSAKASFTPIRIYAVPEGSGNKLVAKITVV